MLYLFHGNDANKVRAKAFQWTSAARAKAPDAFYMRIGSDSLTQEALTESMGLQGLFFAKALVVLDDPFATADSSDLIFTNLDALSASPNIIALVAPKLIPARLKKLEGKVEKVFKVDATAKPARGFNSGLVNALAAKNGVALWTEIIQAYRLGDAPEMVHGLLHWKARDLMQKGSAKWSPEEARSLSVELIELLSDSRGKDVELSVALEKFALSIDS